MSGVSDEYGTYEPGEATMGAQAFTIKDSGERQKFASGMVRDTTAGKTNYLRVLDGPMLQRWAEHLTKGAAKYPDVRPGVPNWTLASGEAEYQRALESAARHFMQYMRGDRDEDHAAGVFFNLNLAEFIREKLLCSEKSDKALSSSPRES